MAVIAPLGILFVMLLSASVLLPDTIRSKVEKEVPGVQAIGGISWNLRSVTLKTVLVNRPGMIGKIKEVKVLLDWNNFKPSPEFIEVRGGHLTIDYVKRSPSSEEGGPSKSSMLKKLSVFELDTLKVVKGDYVGVAHGVNLTNGDMCCAAGGVVLDPHLKHSMFIRDHRVDLGPFCVNLEAKTAEIKSVTTTINPPEGVPGISSMGHDVVATDVEVDFPAHTFKMERLAISELLTGYGVTLSYQEVQHLALLDVQKLETSHPWVTSSEDPLGQVEFREIKAEVPLEGPKFARVSSKGTTLHIDLNRGKMSGRADCNAWAQALPYPKLKEFDDPHFFTGELGFSVDTGPSKDVKLSYNCKATCAAPLLARLKKPFTYEAYTSDGKTLFTRTSGAGSPDWAGLDMIPNYVPQAIVTLEDPAFASHRGLLGVSMYLALKQNIARGDLHIGGSTISQQLAKNLWLRRDKTITRKASEALLTLALESCYTKDKILELYMNVVEYAPNVYGIRAAAKHYFNKEVSELEPEEAYYLASLLPHPKSAVPPYQGGLDNARKLMSTLAENGQIPTDLDQTANTTGWTASE